MGSVIRMAGVARLTETEVGDCRFLAARKRGAVGCGVPGSPLFARFCRRWLVWFLLWFPLL
jgi:hypothetical protein